jgi:peroxiredoxin Q/BCP
LSDPDLTAHKAYEAYGEKTMYGKKVMGTIRSTFLIDGRVDGKARIARIWRNVKVDGHVDQVLEAIGEVTSQAEAASKKKG